MRHTEHGPGRDPAVAPGGDRSAPEAGHETQDVSIGAIVKFGAGLAIAAAVVSVAMWGLFRFFEAQHEKREQPVPPMVAANLKRTPREPWLEPDPLSPRRRMQAEENAALTTYAWVDRDAGVVRIPIERAMELLVEKGLPPSKAMAPTPGPGNGKQETANDPRAGTP